MKLRFFIFPLLLLGISFGLPSSCENPGSRREQIPKPGEIIYEVRAAYPRFEEIPRFITAPGTFLASDKLIVKSELSGVIEKSFLNQGDFVAVGDPLCLFRKEELATAISKKQTELQETLATLEHTQKIYGIAPASEPPTPSLPAPPSKEPLFLDEDNKLPPPKGNEPAANEALPEPEEDGLTKVKMLEATVARMQQELDELQGQILKLTVTAPIAGMIQARQVTEGSAVQAGEPLFEIVTLNPITLSFNVPQEVSAYVDKFIKVTATPAVAPEQTLEGTVFYISPSVDPVKKTLEIRMHLPNENGIIREGQEGKAFVSTRKMEKVLIAPPEAVSTEGNKHFIYVVGGNKVQKTEVKLGQKTDLGVEIDANLRVDDPIVVSPPANLKDGSFVKVKETLPLTPLS